MIHQSRKNKRFQEFNDFDVERLLKKTIDTLDEEIQKKIAILNNPPIPLDQQTIQRFAQEIENDAAEILRVTSILTHTDDIYSYFSNGPLFRKDRDAK